MRNAIVAADPVTARDVAVQFWFDVDDGDSCHSRTFSLRSREEAGVTLVYLAITAAAAIFVSFLPGGRRGVGEANQVLEHNNRVLLAAISMSVRAPVEHEGQLPSLH